MQFTPLAGSRVRYAGVQRFRDLVMNQVEILRGDDIGRKHIDDVSQRAKKNSRLEKEIVKFEPQRRGVTGIIGFELNDRDGSDAACLADSGMMTDLRQALLVDGRDVGDALQNGFVLEDS